ncbi:hypothetical protein SDRG_11339 [Saprolegnia diclina VS20]|uniref:Uncharacterized protein n=1 Tax=Saprolegnia diclina (strain VS20) TaxID=1156394 RepID=T0RLJ3_SAPDV|nr:hypothetical protein SDRG_11339 [Saprolegnia diclina VS20]EQC30857.1 hypothetical protein SDRG_11339 [Saprolegnia diclina VS20]|eukprot:XP_008615595.1 hypothetical protein SDRG_11339 [Saprolegnia diclina VS20]
MFKVFRRSTPEANVKPTRNNSVKGWFQQVIQTNNNHTKCTCTKHKKKKASTKPRKVKPCVVTPFVKIPRKYDGDEQRRSMCVGGVRVPFLPAQVSAWKQIRRDFVDFTPIEEEAHRCEYCLCKSDVTDDSFDDDDDDLHTLCANVGRRRNRWELAFHFPIAGDNMFRRRTSDAHVKDVTSMKDSALASTEVKGFKRWFKTLRVAPMSKGRCTCARSAPGPPRRRRRTTYQLVEPLALPRKYAAETQKSQLVSGRRVPFLPDQVNNWKAIRSAFHDYAPIEEDRPLCDYCLSKSGTTEWSVEDDEY